MFKEAAPNESAGRVLFLIPDAQARISKSPKAPGCGNLFASLATRWATRPAGR